MMWNRLAEARNCLSDRSGRARAVRELWSRRCCWRSDASAGDKKSAVDRLRASERGPWVCGSTAESRTRADSPYPPSNTAYILVSTAPAPQDPRSVTLVAARRTAPVPAYSPPRDPLAIAGCPPPTVSCAGRRGRRTHAGRSSVVRCRAQCPVPGARCPVPSAARCPVQYAQCRVHSAVCPMPNVPQCPMPN